MTDFVFRNATFMIIMAHETFIPTVVREGSKSSFGDCFPACLKLSFFLGLIYTSWLKLKKWI